MNFALEFKAFTLELQADFIVFGALHLHDGGGQLGHSLESSIEFVVRYNPQVLQKVGVMGEEHDVQALGRDAGGGDFPGVFGDDAGFIEEVVEGDPFFVAAGAPFREILLGDRPAFELIDHHLHHLGERVEPFDETDSWLAIGEALIELLPDFEWETGNFTITCFHSLSVGLRYFG